MRSLLQHSSVKTLGYLTLAINQHVVYNLNNFGIIKKSNHYTRRITLKRVTSGGAHLGSLTPGTQLRRNVKRSNFTGHKIQAHTSHIASDVLTTAPTDQYFDTINLAIS